MAKRQSGLQRQLNALIKKKGTPLWLVVLCIIALLVLQWQTGDEPPVDTGDPNATYRVERVVDGDTLVLAGGERVRLIGVNTPETVAPNRPVEPFGPEASAFTKQRLEGQTVRLEFDKERRDRYGRLLAYVYLGDLLFNEELIRQGLGTAETQYPYSSAMKTRFRDAQEEAKAGKRGIWSQPAVRRAA